MNLAKIAIDARWASIRENYAKARRCNLQNQPTKSPTKIDEEGFFGRCVRHMQYDNLNDACLQSLGM